ncbi:hypothetical protein C8P68_102216 [Mucilaginibacter yixingensis]|uniref:Uncharacterized protein n=1 Tax=Mucilaginibacter yixingensis TaxID=1295612 RepID=A0A2T5JCJ7_9SPHI|nr:hypothetical protein [Mucilaginibacter yixingensis]PTQ99395.1 hypothetical protein C8P68_102216 [Mucilaginibacter yixingensis]
MAFPFTVRYKRKLRGAITPDNQTMALQYIKTRLVEDLADNIVIEEAGVSYKGSTSQWRHAPLAGVDSGRFSLAEINDQWYLIYQIKMHRFFIMLGAMSAVMSISSQEWRMAPLVLLCPGSVIWLFTIIGHEDVPSRIAIGLSNLLFGEEIKSEADKEKLKSWF